MKIVDFNRKEIDRVVEFEKECFADGWNRAMLLSAFDGGRYFGFCVYQKKKLIAFIGCTFADDVVDVESVAVLPEFRRQGIAKVLMLLAEEKALRCKMNALMLEVRASNASAIALYTACGFIKISERKKYYSDGETALVFRKEIKK